MKNIIILIFIYLSAIICSAQTPIFDITDSQNRILKIPNSYIKDLDNLLNIYEGTYLYTNGNTSLKLILQKKTMSFSFDHYEDLIIGEYQYIKDGVEIINTLPKLNQMFSDQSINHAISGNRVLTGMKMGCFDCLPDEKRLVGGIAESGKGAATFNVRIKTVNGQPAIEFFFYWHYTSHVYGTPPSPQPSIPGGTYIMIKQ